MAVLQPPVALEKNSYSLSIQWDVVGGQGIDLDLQAVIVDETGLIVDAAYYNNPTALAGAVGLSKDEQVGNGDGDDENLWIDLKKIPPRVKLIIFVVAVYDGGCLRDVLNGKVCFSEERRQMRVFPIENSRGDADIVCMMRRRRDATWELLQVDQPAESGSHFLDILEPNIGNIIRSEIPSAPRCQRVNFEMDKGAVVPLPQTAAIKRLSVGIGGQLPPNSREEVDIDISAVFMSESGEVLGAVDADCEGKFGLQHSGDRVAGQERGDDEAIAVDLVQVPSIVGCIFMVLSVSKGSFKSVESAYMRVVDQSANQLLRFDVAAGTEENLIVVAKLLRSSGWRWSFQAIGKAMSSRCRTWRGAIDLMQDIARAGQMRRGERGKGKVKAPPSEASASAPGTGAQMTDRSSSNLMLTTDSNIASGRSTSSMRRMMFGASRCSTLGMGDAHSCTSPTINDCISRAGSSGATTQTLHLRGSIRLQRTGRLSASGSCEDAVAFEPDDPAEAGPAAISCAACALCSPAKVAGASQAGPRPAKSVDWAPF
mmetsp:Transcript_30491/g.87036  ORF Transcript_30491/g.87036 Transcript_30491/m.87036 type:complete len:541 (+) Transcript_30491:86-1708(+)